MEFTRTISGKIILFIVLLFSLATYKLTQDRIKANNTCFCAYDGFGYYMYLPHLFQKGNLRMTQEWASELQSNYCPGTPVYQLEQGKHDAPLNIYHMGLSYVFLPSYSIAHVVAYFGNYEQDGFSTPYRTAFHLNSILFLFLGLLYLRKLLLLFTNDRIASMVIILLYLGTNVSITFYKQYDLPHLYLFTLNAIWLYYLFKYNQDNKRSHLIISAVVFGLTTAIRPTQVLLFLLPVIVLLSTCGNKKSTLKKLIFFPTLSLIWNIPQLAYWYVVGGSLFIPNLHTENIVLTDPNLFDFLFSYRKGWLIYSPIFLLLAPGFFLLYRHINSLFWGIALTLSAYIYVMSSWECWWYASSFGSRVMTDIYPLLSIVFVFSFGLSKQTLAKISLGILGGMLIFLNLFQSYQFHLGMISESRMTKEHYWYIFGKTKIANYHNDFLIISRDDLQWPERLKLKSYANFTVRTDTVFSVREPLIVPPTSNLDIGKFTFLEKVETFESLFETTMLLKTSDNAIPSYLKMEAYGRSNYMWNAPDISTSLKESKTFEKLIYKFNLDWIRHKNDGLQIYIHNPNDVELEIKDFTIVAHSLIRK
jgi:hypothetical protein